MVNVNWTDNQILKLIEIWGEEDIHEQLETIKSNTHREWQTNFGYVD